MNTLALIAPVQIIVDVLKPILVFIHDTLGVGWGTSIVLLTVLVRAAMAPLTVKQFKSMRAMAAVAPELKKLQAKYKDDKQRQQQEIMKFYAENKINPFASCLPLLAQFPFFIGLYYLLQSDLRSEICGDAVGKVTDAAGKLLPCGQIPNPTGDEKFLFVPDLTAGATWLGAGHADDPVRRLTAALDAADALDAGPQPADAHVRAAARLRDLHPALQLPGRPARVLDHDEPVDRGAGLAVAQEARPDHADQARRRRQGRRRRRREGHLLLQADERARGEGGARDRARAAAQAERPAAALTAQEEEALRTEAMTVADDEQPGEAVRELLERVVDALGLDATVEIADDGETCTGIVHGDDLGLFIGRHGQTIDAVQHLAQRVSGARAQHGRRIVVDAEGYRERREMILRRQADHAAEDALRHGRPVALDAMTASERRLVHEYLRDHGSVQTYSEGDEPDRHLVVAPLKP